MGQITLYLDSETEAKVKSAAKAVGVSQSKWVAALIKEKTVNEWPAFVGELAGAWDDLLTAEELRANLGEDATRERI